MHVENDVDRPGFAYIAQLRVNSSPNKPTQPDQTHPGTRNKLGIGMQSRFLAVLAAFVTTAVAQTSYTGIASVYEPNAHLPTICGTKISSTDRIVALPFSTFNITQCGQIVAIASLADNYGGEVTLGDLCWDCKGYDIKLNPAAFETYLNETEKAAGITSFPAEYAIIGNV
uniref:Uncharacterized protein n=1 Tax=Mycena chlorophos TaxID=658473 RepID=A0ABQ0LF04_MYCCL|nr:predicted protein [Mycena chlorophos]